jgi:hypothetical protein
MYSITTNEFLARLPHHRNPLLKRITTQHSLSVLDRNPGVQEGGAYLQNDMLADRLGMNVRKFVRINCPKWNNRSSGFFFDRERYVERATNEGRWN